MQEIIMGKTYKIAVFPGDGIGKEIVPQALRVLNAVASKHNINIKSEDALIGGSAIDEFCIPLPEDSLNLALNSDAVLLGAVGG
ncbi:MAG: isocitrate/isopropylmalate family dehydrogenase, partial [Nitrospirota bacterium]